MRDRSAAGAPTTEPASEPHPEEFCGRCGGSNPVWTAPSPLWNAVMRGGSINGVETHGVVCPSCFAALAEVQGIVASAWRFTAKSAEVELETVTPTGRVWNPETWLWDDARAEAGT